MEPSQQLKEGFEELNIERLDGQTIAEMVSNLTMFIEMLAEIDRLSKLHSKYKHLGKE
jgi:hypothetical protein